MDNQWQQGLARRDFLRNTMVLAAPAIVGAPMLSATATTLATFVAPTRSRGATVVDVRAFGAVGDGMHDDTAAFNAAIKSLPEDGGTVTVPAGRYLIDPVKSINLRSQMHLQMELEATLVCKPNSAEKAYVIYAHKVADVEISGGRVVGDR